MVNGVQMRPVYKGKSIKMSSKLFRIIFVNKHFSTIFSVTADT